MALERALAAMTAGRYENQSLEGARTNALESIAWSLMGILEAMIDDEDTQPLRDALAGVIRVHG